MLCRFFVFLTKLVIEPLVLRAQSHRTVYIQSYIELNHQMFPKGNFRTRFDLMKAKWAFYKRSEILASRLVRVSSLMLLWALFILSMAHTEGLVSDVHGAGVTSICPCSQALQFPFESESRTHQHTVLNDP